MDDLFEETRESAGELASESTGERSGQPAGESAGERAGESAGERSGQGSDRRKWLVRSIPPASTREIRGPVLRPGLPLAESAYAGDDDPLALHIGAYARGSLVAVGSLMPEPPPWDPATVGGWRIRGMATLADWRGLGIGGAVLAALLRHACENEGTIVWCAARPAARSFYERVGFESRGELFEVPVIGPHRQMWRKVDVVSLEHRADTPGDSGRRSLM